MKVTKVQPQPPKPDIVITLSWEEAKSLSNRLTGYGNYSQTIIAALITDLRAVLNEG